ncbi:MAG: SIMPL domain-containing protein, partial [Gemmatimonadota bacterium]
QDFSKGDGQGRPMMKAKILLTLLTTALLAGCLGGDEPTDTGDDPGDAMVDADAPVNVTDLITEREAVGDAPIVLERSVVDAAVDAGANRVTGIEFELADPEAAYHEALRRAIDQARREAEVAAAALGESLGPPMSLNTSGFNAPAQRVMMESMDLRGAATTPVQPGELDVRASVSITYRLGS